MLSNATFAAAQCERPPIPVGGLEVVTLPPEVVQYADGVHAEAWLTRPTAAPPACGWPLVVYVHSLGQLRTQDWDWQREIASFGFAVWSYDVRGQGRTRELSPEAGTTLYGPTERYDLAEQIARARQHQGVHQTRVAVIGVSQGGMHAWMAAVQSGFDLTVEGRGTIAFPEITCVVGADFVTEPLDHRLRGGTLFASIFVDTVASDPAVSPFLVDRAFADEVLRHFRAQDPAGLIAMHHAEPGRLVAAELGRVQVPILFNHAYYDSVCDPGPILTAAAALPPATPFRLVLSGVGHSVPQNVYEGRLRRELALRWLERFLWDEPNGVDREAPLVFARAPVDATRYHDTGSLWPHVFEPALPPLPDVAPERWYLHAGGLLAAEPMAPAGPVTPIVHTVEPGFTPEVWLNDPATHAPEELLDRIPLSEHRFTLTTNRQIELAGRARVTLNVTPDAPRFTIAALLLVRLPGSEVDWMLAHGGRGAVDAVPNTPIEFAFDLSPIACTLPAGSRLVLSLRNHWLTEAPHLRGIVTVPWFSDSSVEVAHGQGPFASSIDLPVREAVRPTLVVDRHRLALTGPGRVAFMLDGGEARAGQPYVLATSMSGHTPGLALPGGELPLVEDAWMLVVASLLGAPEIHAFVGNLDGSGVARPALDLSGITALPVELLDQRMSFAAWIYRSASDLTGAATNPVDLRLR